MKWHEFVFSQKPAKRLLRHLVFWVAWWIYFSVCHYLFQQPLEGGTKPYFVTVGSYLFIKTVLLVFISAVACYTFIYLILPQLIKGKRLKPFANVLVLCTFLFVTGYFTYWNVFPIVDSLFGPYQANKFFTRFWPAVSLGLLDPLKVVAAAASIKYVKYWWLKKEESKNLEREKISAELQLLKAQIHPNFLFQALNNIYVYSLTASPRAPEMLLKLSDLLSYILYECDQPLVLLEKEIEMMKDYLALEKIRLNDSVEMELSITGDMTGKMIAPFLLLPFIENSFKHSKGNTEHAWINMDISVEGNSFSMKLANGTMQEGSEGIAPLTTKDLANVQKRLTLLYPQVHELKISHEQEMMIVSLKIQLTDTSIAETGKNENPLIIEPIGTQPTIYAAQ